MTLLQWLRALFAMARPAPAPTPSPTSGAYPGLAESNAARARFGLRPLAWSPSLTIMASRQAVQCATEDAPTHDGPGSPVPDLAARAAQAGYHWTVIAENADAGWGMPLTAHGAVQGWLNSPPHRVNLLNPAVTEMGMAKATNRQGGTFWVADYGRPATS